MSEFPHRSDSSAVTVSCIYADPLRTVSGGILSVLTWTVPRVPTVPQQNVTIVTRELLASAERQTLFFFPLRLNGLEAESHDEPSTPFPCEQLGARRGEARRPSCWCVCHWAVQRAPRRAGGLRGQRPVALAARESAATVRERLDGRTCDTQSDDRVTVGGGLHVQIRWLIRRNAENLCNELTTAVRWKFEEMIRN